MADSDSVQNRGEKRPIDSTGDEKRPPKVRRFDMKTRVPKIQKTDNDSIVGSQNVEENKRLARTKKPLVVTTVVVRSEGTKTVTDARLPTAEKPAEVSQRLESSDTTSHGSKSDVRGNVEKELSAEPGPKAMSVNKMFETSLELQQSEVGGTRKEERGHRRNIVDQLFQDFVSTKMREVDDRVKSSPGEGSTDNTEPESEKTQVSLSEEINRLLDAEITSIKSRSVVGDLTAGDMELNSGKSLTHGDSKSTSGSDSTPAAPAVSRSAPEPSALAQAPSVADAFADCVDTVVTPVDVGSNEVSEQLCTEVVVLPPVRKKLETKKLGLSIGAETLARITGNWKNGHILEDGEVASSTDSDGDKAFKVSRATEEESDDSGEVSGTGSLSDSDKGKDGKSKKKKKHKHKHKKKKKHKSQSKEKEKEEEEKSTHSTERKSAKDKKERWASKEKSDRRSSKEEKSERRSSKEEKSERRSSKEEKSERRSSKDQKEKEESSEGAAKESKSKDRKKSSHRKSKSPPEPFDPWDARNYRVDGAARSRSRSPHSSKSRHRERSKERHRDRSKERTRDRSKDRHRGKHKSRSRERSRKRSRSRDRGRRAGEDGEARDKEQADLRLQIDKNKLRKIAIARALANMEKGKGPSVDLTLAKSGGKSVAELTEFCKRISEREMADGSSDSEASEEEKGSEGEDGSFHHPFIMRDPSTLPNIVMNIRNAKQLPVLTPQEKQTQAATLRTQFPVSSGTQHRIKESEWVPVTTTTTTAATTSAKAAPSNAAASSSATVTATTCAGGSQQPAAASLPTPTASAAESVFPPAQDLAIKSIVSERVQAMRRLQQNPFDLQALNSVHRVNEQANAWAQSKHLPGQFTGTTDVKILTQEELAGPDKRNQAWVKKDQFRRAPPLQGGIGMFLLQKMGWKPGDGLGKDNEGNREPLMLDVKMDRKGLSTSQDHRPVPPLVRPSLPFPHPGPGPGMPGMPPPGHGFPPGRGILPHPGFPHQPHPGAPAPAPGPAPAPALAPAPPRAKDLSGKHPVSALTELCTKRRWGAPAFDLVSETGPAHKRMFLFKVRVNGVEYMPSASCGNKKLAKAQAAAVCLQEMGLIPRDFVVQV